MKHVLRIRPKEAARMKLEIKRKEKTTVLQCLSKQMLKVSVKKLVISMKNQINIIF